MEGLRLLNNRTFGRQGIGLVWAVWALGWQMSGLRSLEGLRVLGFEFAPSLSKVSRRGCPAAIQGLCAFGLETSRLRLVSQEGDGACISSVRWVLALNRKL